MSKTPMNTTEFIELACSIASYVLEDTYLDYPYEENDSGDLVYTDEAQDRFNEHYDVIEGLLSEFIEKREAVKISEAQI